MRVANRVDQAVRAMLVVAEAAGPSTCREVATRTGLSAHTLAGLLAALERASLLSSTRGRHGGYQLARPVDDITLGDVITALDDLDVPFDPASPLAAVWDDLHREALLAAAQRSLADLAFPTSPAPP